MSTLVQRGWVITALSPRIEVPGCSISRGCAELEAALDESLDDFEAGRVVDGASVRAMRAIG